MLEMRYGDSKQPWRSHGDHRRVVRTFDPWPVYTAETCLATEGRAQSLYPTLNVASHSLLFCQWRCKGLFQSQWCTENAAGCERAHSVIRRRLHKWVKLRTVTLCRCRRNPFVPVRLRILLSVWAFLGSPSAISSTLNQGNRAYGNWHRLFDLFWISARRSTELIESEGHTLVMIFHFSAEKLSSPENFWTTLVSVCPSVYGFKVSFLVSA